MPEKIKIAYILPTLDRGGAERLTTDLILNLDPEKFSPLLILFKRGGEWLAELTAENIPVIVLEKKWKLDFNNFLKILKALKDFRPEIVHTHLGGDLYGRLAAKILKVPVIVSTEHNVNRDESLFTNQLKRLTNHWADKIVAVSEAVKKDLANRYKTTPDKIAVIYNGLNIKNFLAYQKTEIILHRPVTFGTLGRLSKQKGQAVLIRALKQLKTPEFKCLIGGQGTLLSNLKQETKRLDLADKVQFVGAVANPPAFLNSLDFFVLPSLWEGLGIVILEAGLIGLPIIASEVDGLKELITKDTGWLVPAGDEQTLTDKIDWLINNLDSPEVIHRSDNLRRRVQSEFDIRKVTEQYENMYQYLLALKIKKL